MREYTRVVSNDPSPSTTQSMPTQPTKILDKLEIHQISEIKQIISNFPLTVNGLRTKVNQSYLGMQLSYKDTRSILVEVGYR